MRPFIDVLTGGAFTATLGLSYTHDKKEIEARQPHNEDLYSTFDLPGAPTVFGVPVSQLGLVDPAFEPLVAALPGLQGAQFLPSFLDLPNAVESNKTADSKTTWTARLAYQFNDNINFFATGATGFKATSWNLTRDARPLPRDAAALTSAGLSQANQTYGTRFAAPEEATVYELGMKARFKNGALNVTIFDQTIEGFQSSIFVGTGFGCPSGVRSLIQCWLKNR